MKMRIENILFLPGNGGWRNSWKTIICFHANGVIDVVEAPTDQQWHRRNDSFVGLINVRAFPPPFTCNLSNVLTHTIPRKSVRWITQSLEKETRETKVKKFRRSCFGNDFIYIFLSFARSHNICSRLHTPPHALFLISTPRWTLFPSCLNGTRATSTNGANRMCQDNIYL